MISIRHREELHLRAVVIPTWVYAILWRSSFVYTSALIRRSPNSAPHGTHYYQSHSARPYNSGRPPRRSIVALSHSANSYLLLLGVTIFNIYIESVGNSCGVINNINTSSRRIASNSGSGTYLGLCNSVAIFLCLYFRTDT